MQHGITLDEKGQEQPTDKERASGRIKTAIHQDKK
jgi:hypothetical protein